MAAKHTENRNIVSTDSLKKGVLLAVACLLVSGSFLTGQETAPPASPAAIATNEVMRRQQMLATAQQLIQAGSMAQTDRSYGEAMDNFKAAFEMLPEVPAVAATRRAVFRRYQAATVQYAQQMIDEARWPQAKHVLENAVALGAEAGLDSSMDPGLKRMLENLNDPEYYATAISPQHIENVQKVRQLLITAQGYLDYGDFDRAALTYNRVLLIDRYNSAARRGIENVERHKMNYFDVARDQTRATKLREIAEEWEMPVPRSIGSDIVIDDQISVVSRREALQEKLQTIVIPSLEVNQATLRDVMQLLEQQSRALDFAESDINLKGINLLLDTGSFGAGEDPGAKTLSLKLNNVPLGVVLKYVTQQTGTKYQVDNFAVRILSTSADAQQVLENRTWTVPPGFLSRGDLGNDIQLNADPFADQGNNGVAGSVLVKRKTAKEFLEESGVTFVEGAIANYNPATSTLLVRNTPDQLTMVDNLVQAARDGVNKMVEVGLKIISITQENVKQLGVDSLLGQANLGSTPRVFAGGGTYGGTDPGTFPFVNPGTGTPVGAYPLTSGLRTGSLKTTQSIDDIITRELGTGAATSGAPSVFTVAGVFTDPQFQSTLRLLSQAKGTDFLCDTKLLVRPGQRGKVEIIREFIYPTEYDPPEVPNQFGDTNLVAIGFASATISPAPITPATPTAFEMRPVGKTIEVEPTVSEDNHSVSLDLLIDFTDFTGFINYGVPITSIGQVLGAGGPPPQNSTDNRILMPVFDTVREATNVNVWDGQTVAIGGFHGHSVVDSEDKTPFLGDLPVLGRLFRSATEDHVKRAILIFATVRLLDPAGEPINQVVDDNDANEFPPQSNRPPVPPAAGSFAPPSYPYQK